ncbi:MAG: UDP-N-acetylmuramate--L-alanine ligase [Pseudomonadota bacterium]
MKHAVNRIHFIGIGGVGMSGIAEVLQNLNYKVSGSDMSDSTILRRLTQLGIKTYIGHAADNLEKVDVVVISSAVKADNPEVVEARYRNIPVVPRAVMLAELMRMKQGIAIAGTHGKTTTTSLVASVLAEAGLDPTFVIGGLLNSADANAKLGSGDYIVVEADESDASFLNLLPVMAVVTNIDEDHMETYGHDFQKLKTSFVEFLHRMPFYGAAIVCVDDVAVREIIPSIARPVITYGLSDGAQVRAVDIVAKNGAMTFNVQFKDADKLHTFAIELNLPGLHNVKNALAAIAVALELEIKSDSIQKALSQFRGVDRRFQKYGEIPAKTGGTYSLIDDYGHHPVEMKATIDAARGAYPGRRLLLAFQPHRYSRTRDCFEDFIKVMAAVDVVLLSEVYPAGEAKIVGADGRSLCRALRLNGNVEPIFVDDIQSMAGEIINSAKDGDVVLCMGAGSISATPRNIVHAVQQANSFKNKMNASK